MPSWGRPPGAKGSKQRKRWEREKALWEQEQIRIEELDSDDSDIQGVGLAYGEKRFVSDPLKFTGIDLSTKPRERRGYTFNDDSESDSDGGRSRSDDDGNESARQVALRDKEEALVQSALARIRKAQERGKREVKLNPEELAALEKRKKRMQSAATSKPKKGSGSSGSGGERKRRSDRALVTVPIVQPEPRRHSDRHRDHSPPRTSSGGPGMVVEGPDGVVTYAPIGHFPPSASSRNSPTRPRSSTSLSQQSRHTPPPFLSEHPQGGRHYSEEMLPTASGQSPRIPLPHEESWTPSSRRSSASSQGYSHDPFDYQVSSGYPVQTSGRRNASGPPQVSYSSIRRSPPVATSSSSSKMRYSVAASSSDPNLGRRRGEDEIPDSMDSRSSSEEDDDESDDLGNGVSVEPERPSASVSRKSVGGHHSGGGRKKGRR
jgi:PRA1 family protein 1